MFVFHDFGDVNAVVMGFWKGFFSLFDIFFINVKFLDVGVFPDVVLLELRVEAKRDGGVKGVFSSLRAQVLGILYTEIPS